MFLSITLISLGHISFARLSWPWLCISRQHSRSLRFSFGCRHDLHSLLRYGIATRIGRKSARRRRCRRNWISGAPLGQWLRPNSCQRGAHCRLTKGGRDARLIADRRPALLSGARGLSVWSMKRKFRRCRMCDLSLRLRRQKLKSVRALTAQPNLKPLCRIAGGYKLPPSSLLHRPDEQRAIDADELKLLAQVLTDKYA